MNHLKELQQILRTPLLVNTQPHLRYLCGFTGSSGTLVITKLKAWFFTDPRYTAVAQEQIKPPVKVVTLDKNQPDAFKNFLLSQKLPALALEPDRTSLEDYTTLRQKLGRLVCLSNSNPIPTLREIKTPEEIKLLKRAGQITVQIFRQLKPKVKLGMTELDLAWEIQSLAHQLKASQLAFDSIVAFGANTATPHHQTGNTKLKKGDIIQLDYGAEYEGYKSDCSRTLFFKEPKPYLAELYQNILTLQTAALAAIRPNISAGTLAKNFPPQTFLKNGETLVSHGLGHGVGLEIHELPNLKPNSTTRLKPGHIVTVEPGLYYENLAGMRLEDTVLITQDGYENLTPAPKRLRDNLL